MSFESGILVRRQQREYPPELRQEIALAALEFGNNREVARLYSNKLGYIVNESTVRGIKKRYIEGIQKGKIPAPVELLEGAGARVSLVDGEAVCNNSNSPKAGDQAADTEDNGEDHVEDEDEEIEEIEEAGQSKAADEQEGEEEEDEEEEDTEGEVIRPEAVMKLQLEILEGKMKEERAGATVSEDESTIENGDNDSRDGNPLSIDTGEGDDPKPVIRINKDLQSESGLLKRKAEASSVGNSNGPPVRKVRPSNAENEADIQTLEKEIRALHWLARRKEQEWDQVVRLMKQKEEKLLQAQRTRTLISVEGQHLLSRSNSGPIIIPQQQIILLPKPVQPVQKIQQPTSLPRPAVLSNHTPAVPVESITEQKLTNLMQKANQNLEKASEGKNEKGKTPFCQGCRNKKSEFVCAGCSNRWYCSRECQVEDWDDHADDCSG